MIDVDPELVGRGRVLAARVEPLDDLAELVRSEHDRRVAELIE